MWYANVVTQHCNLFSACSHAHNVTGTPCKAVLCHTDQHAANQAASLSGHALVHVRTHLESMLCYLQAAWYAS